MTSPLKSGRPHPLGAHYDGAGTNFALFSDHADAVVLCLFSDDGKREIARHELPECTNGIWHGYLADVKPGQLYGYRVAGPWAPREGHRFNAAKLLLDPYARMLAGELTWNPAVFGYDLNGGDDRDLIISELDSAPFVPKARVVESGIWSKTPPPRVPWPKTVIYESHVRGLTMRHPLIPNDLRGTFAALARPEMLEHFAKIGVTTIELLPIHAFAQDSHLLERGLRNYWGYNTLSFFAPEPGYLHSGELEDIARGVDALHKAGLEVILDVVYNHTCEGNHFGPTLSWKGIDNLSYYRPLPGQPRYYDDFTGCGNSLNTLHPKVLQMVLDSLRLWATTYGVDGFRFDLCLTLGRRPDGFSPDHAFFHSILQDPVLGPLKLIAEPWDTGPGGYALGAFPPGFSEWNGEYRDTVRDFWNGSEGMLGAFAQRFAASSDMFGSSRRRPWSSVNFITAHDGFTLHDLVTYNEKHNQANGENNQDGANDNRSWNCGVEGETEDAAINALRAQQKRNLLATLYLSQGVPMLLAGDEISNTQGGNNNTYCQDSEIGWVDWSRSDESMLAFVARLAKLRQSNGALSRPEFLSGAQNFRGQPDIAWYNANGQLMTEAQWAEAHNRCLTVRLAAANKRDRPLLILFNASHLEVTFGVPAESAATSWSLELATCESALPEQITGGSELAVPGRSVLVYAART
jgi:isoamylase